MSTPKITLTASKLDTTTLALYLHEPVKNVPGFEHCSAKIDHTLYAKRAPYYAVTLHVRIKGFLRSTQSYPQPTLEEAVKEALNEMKVILGSKVLNHEQVAA